MIIVKQLRSFLVEKTKYVIMIFLMQMVLIIGVLFLSGVIVNNSKAVNEDVLRTLKIEIRFTDKVEYDDVEPAVINCTKKYPNLINDVSVMKPVFEDNSDKGRKQLYGYALYKDGQYATSESTIRDQRRLEWGRTITEDDVINKRPVAVVYDYDKEINGELVINNIPYEIVGEIYTPDRYASGIVNLPITCFYDIDILSLTLSTNSIISQSQINYLTMELDKNVGGKYELIRDEGDIPDAKSIARIILLSSALILVIVISTIIMMYSYLLNESKYRLGVWKLLGCKHSRAAAYFTGVMAIFLFIASFVGIVVFIMTEKLVLEKIYYYMEDFYNWKIYLGLPALIYLFTLITVFLFSLWGTKGKVRKLLV